MKVLNNVVVTDIEGIDYRDAFDFCDAYISKAEINGRDMTEDELEELNEDKDFVHQEVLNWIN